MRRIIPVLSFLTILSTCLYGQQIDVAGKVTDANDGTPLVGATVVVKGTNTGVVTDVDGNFKLTDVESGRIIIVSFIGYISEEFSASSGLTEIALRQDIEEMDEVVVTALGIEREIKTLGYAMEEVGGDVLSEAREANLVNSLNGRVAGVHITNGNTGAGSSSRITIRGESSISGDNQPLFVVDGVPVRNATDTRSNSGIADNMELDYGNGIAEINPEDIESISILKGPNAAALYGSRAGNGVVIINTKNGKGKKGIGVSYTLTGTWETLLAYPDYQSLYGQGKNGEFAFEDGYGSGVYDGVDESWGPRLDMIVTEDMLDENGEFAGVPQTVGTILQLPQFDSPTSMGLRGGDVHGLSYQLGSSGVDLERRGEITPTPWVHHGDPVEDFMETGTTFTNNLAFYGGNDKGDFRVSLTNFNNKGIVPNTDLRRNSVNINAGYDLTKRLHVRTNVNYINSQSDHRHANSYGTESIMYLFTWYGMQINTESLKDYWQRGLEGFQQYNYNYNYHDNPYFNAYENTNGLSKDRIIGNVSVAYDLTNDLTLMVKSGTDFYDELRQIKRAYSTQRFPNGQYREDKIKFTEINTEFLVSYKKVLGINWELIANFGGNIMKQKDHFHALSNNKLVIPDVYTFENTDIPLQAQLYRSEKQINSLYGYAQLGYKEMIYLDFSGRNDWSSTLPKANNSYFYPSVSISGILSEMVDLPAPFSFFKLRAGWAQVGNDTDPYRITDFYNFGVPFGDNLTAYESSTISNKDLKPEIKTSWELGADIRFFRNRLGFDFTYYSENTKNQILAISLSNTSGYTKQIINAGSISNKGIEFIFTAMPVSTASGFSWNVNLNFSKNTNMVEELTEGIDEYVIADNRITLIARPDGRMGDMYGTGFLETENGEIIWRDGLPVEDGELRLLGNYNPDFMMGIANDFRFKNITLSILFDWKKGGDLISLTRLIAATSGNIEETVVGRETGMIGEGVRENYLYNENGQVVLDGSGIPVLDPDQPYVPNDVVVEASAYHNKRYKRQNESQGMYDASYVKLREVKLGFILPKKLFTDNFIESAHIAFVGRNLMLWTRFNHGDPEVISYNGSGQIIPGVEDMSLPSTRSMGFSLNITF
jgi:TonB-linked SusC/RagA family outer membrane protein